MVSPVLYSSKSAEWETPQDLFDQLNAKYKFTLDACASHANAKCKYYFTREEDGLQHSWGGHRVWCNPPYGRGIDAWVNRCALAYRGVPSRPELAVMLLPARTDTKWWHDHVIPYGKVEFIRGRLKFGGHKNSAPFPSAIVVFGAP